MSNILGGVYIKPNSGDTQSLRIDGTGTTNNLYINNNGFIGFGTSGDGGYGFRNIKTSLFDFGNVAGAFPFKIDGTTNSITSGYGYFSGIYHTHNTTTPASSVGLYINETNQNTAYDAVGVFSQVVSSGHGKGQALWGRVLNAGYGIKGDSQTSTSGSTTNIGVYGSGSASNSGVTGTIHGGYFTASGSGGSPNNTTIGGYFFGGYASSETTGLSYGVFSEAGNKGTNTAGYFRAYNGNNNYAIVTNGGNSGFNDTAPTAMVDIKGINALATDYALKVRNGNGSPDPLLYVRNDKKVIINGTIPVTANSINWDVTIGDGTNGGKNIYLNSQGGGYVSNIRSNQTISVGSAGARTEMWGHDGGGGSVITLGGYYAGWTNFGTYDGPDVTSQTATFSIAGNSGMIMYGRNGSGQAYLHTFAGQATSSASYLYGAPVSYAATTFSVGKYNPSAKFTILQSQDGISGRHVVSTGNTGFGTYGVGFVYENGTFYTSDTPSGTTTDIYIHRLGVPTLSSQVNALTGTNVSTLYVDAPTEGSNFSIQNKYAIIANSTIKSTNVESNALDISGSTGYNQLRVRTSYTPSASGDTNGNIGEIAWDNDYVYVKTNTGWGRSSLSYAF